MEYKFVDFFKISDCVSFGLERSHILELCVDGQLKAFCLEEVYLYELGKVRPKEKMTKFFILNPSSISRYLIDSRRVKYQSSLVFDQELSGGLLIYLSDIENLDVQSGVEIFFFDKKSYTHIDPDQGLLFLKKDIIRLKGKGEKHAESKHKKPGKDSEQVCEFNKFLIKAVVKLKREDNLDSLLNKRGRFKVKGIMDFVDRHPKLSADICDPDSGEFKYGHSKPSIERRLKEINNLDTCDAEVDNITS